MSHLFSSGLLVMLLSILSLSQGGTTPRDEIKPSKGPAKSKTDRSPLGIAWGFIYGAGDVKAHVYMPQLRELGASHTKLYLFWNQLEPEKGKFDWSALDALLNQLDSPDEALVSIFATSRWATRESALILPPSPAKNPDDYYRFIHRVVSHCKGRIRYWQNDSEPNNPVYWAGTPQEFVAELKLFYRAVKDADPQAIVVCGGYDGIFNPPGLRPIPGQDRSLAFFDQVIREGNPYFDIFDLRLYGNIDTIPARIEFIRKKLTDAGATKPIICTEYHGPGLFEFAENRKYVGLIGAWTQSITNQRDAEQSKNLTRSQQQAVRDLYKDMSNLAPQTQMFMVGCPPELENRFQRIACRQLVMRNLLALSAGIERTLFWDFWHDRSQPHDLMQLMFGKQVLMDLVDGQFKPKKPITDTFRLLAHALVGTKKVRKIDVPGRPSFQLFEVDRNERSPLLVVWERRDPFKGEEEPPMRFAWKWPYPAARATDALGNGVRAELREGKLNVEVGATPILIEAER
jgi:hypothetical protein